MKKKVLTAVMCTLLTGAAALPVSAEEKQTDIEATVGSEYILTIPGRTVITPGTAASPLNGELKVTGNVRPSEIVTVSVSSGAFANAEQGTQLAYSLTDHETDAVFSGAIWNEEELRSGNKSYSLDIDIAEAAWEAAEAGAYKGTITFTATLSDTAAQP